MTKQKQDRRAKTLPTSHPQRLTVLIASACTGVIALYFSILAIGNFLSLFAYVIFFCSLVAPFITTRRIGKGYAIVTLAVTCVMIFILTAESWGRTLPILGAQCHGYMYSHPLCTYSAKSFTWALGSALIPWLSILCTTSTMVQIVNHRKGVLFDSSYFKLKLHNPFDKKLTKLLWTYAGWLSIVLWIVIIVMASSSGFLGKLLPPMHTEDSNFVAKCILLIPIAITSFLLVYKMDFRSFTVSNKPPTLRLWLRILSGILVTAFVLVISWYAFLYSVFTLSFLSLSR